MSEKDSANVQTLVANIAARMRVDLADGYRLAAKVALAALEPSDGVFYSASASDDLRRAHHRVKQKLQEAAEAWNIDMDLKP
jgi:hypothetical protein